MEAIGAGGLPRLGTGLLAWLLVAMPASSEPASDFHHAAEIRTIAFGSCFNPRNKVAEAFDGVIRHRPDVFVFLGDNIYGDTNDMDVLRAKYAELEAVDGFRKLRENTTLIATWDDHDYGVNDGGKSYPMRRESQRIFLDFFKDSPDSPRRKREGVYGAHAFGPEGRVCQIILLDTRYFRDELPRSKKPKAEGTVGWYEPTDDRTKTLLGEDQWRWLDEQLKVPADIRIIASSIQVLAAEKGMENWGNVPHEQRRLFDMLKKNRADHCFAISGDVHFTELSKRDLDGYPFFDFTSSGLSHGSKSWASAGNSFRVGESYAGLNAGLIEIDWEKMSVALSAIRPDGEKVFTHAVDLTELEFR